MRAYYLTYLGGLLVLEAAVIVAVTVYCSQKEKKEKQARQEMLAKEKKDRCLAAQNKE